MLIEVDFYDLTVLLKGLGYDNEDIIAEYITDCCCSEINVKYWLGNANYNCFKNKDEALNYIKEQGYTLEDNCIVYEGDCGIFVELY